MLLDVPTMIGFMAIVVILGFVALSFGLQKGLERITKYMMVLLLALMVVLAIRGFWLDGAAEGLKFYLVPNFSKLSGNVVVDAMNQAFFTLSLGIGSMAIFGSYIDKKRTLLGESINILALDTFVAIVAGLIIFPALYSFNDNVDTLPDELKSGPGLLFITMAKAFNNMQGGRIWGSFFFLFMLLLDISNSLFGVGQMGCNGSFAACEHIFFFAQGTNIVLQQLILLFLIAHNHYRNNSCCTSPQ